MPNYLIKPEAAHLADPGDLTGAKLVMNAGDPATIDTLPNGVAHIAMEVLLSPESESFTPSSLPEQMGAPFVAASDTSLTVTLAADPADGGASITGYDLRYSLNGTGWTDITTIPSPYVLGSLTAATLYHVQTRAVNANGAGPWSISTITSTLAATTEPASFDISNWDVLDAGTGGDATLLIASLPSDGGSPITDIEYRIGGGSWISTGQSSAGSYPLNNAFTDGIEAFVQLRALNGIGPGPASDIKEVTTSVTVDLTENADGEAELLGTGSGTLSLTAPAIYAGSFNIDTADLDAGPTNLVPPALNDDGSPTEGETITLIPGLWLYDDAGPKPIVSHQWTRDGNDIAGATAQSYVVAASDVGTNLACRERAAQSGIGTRSTTSAAVSISNTGPAGAEDFSGFSSNQNIASSQNWTQTRGSTPIIVNANGYAQPDISVGAASGNINVIHSITPGQAQFAEITFEQAAAPTNNEVGVILRWTNDGPASFIWVFFNGNNNIRIQTFNNGSFTNNLNIGGWNFGQGDVLRVEITAADVLTFSKNGSQVSGAYNLSGDVPTTGQVGMYIDIDAGNTALPILTQFNGGDL